MHVHRKPVDMAQLFEYVATFIVYYIQVIKCWCALHRFCQLFIY